MKSPLLRSLLAIEYRGIPQWPSRALRSLISLSLALVVGCASPPISPNTNPDKTSAATAYVTLPLDDPASEYEVVKWLLAGGARVEKDPNGDDRIFDSPTCRNILVRYRRMLRARLNVIAQNIGNANTTRDAQGAINPYRRQVTTVEANGIIKLNTDPTPFQKRYSPGHPDADSQGYVNYPNVDLVAEQINAIETTNSYRMVTQILLRFDSTLIDTASDEPANAQ